MPATAPYWQLPPQLLLWAGVAIVVFAFYLIIKRIDVRIILLISGLVMCLLGGYPKNAIDAFTNGLISPFVGPIIMNALGYTYVMQTTGCDKELMKVLMKVISKHRWMLLPGGVLVGYIISFFLGSGIASTAVVAPVLAPVMLTMGFKGYAVALTIMFGSWGFYASLGSVFQAQAAEIAGTTIIAFLPQLLAVSVVAMIVLVAVFYLCDKLLYQKGKYEEVDPATIKEVDLNEKVNPLKAIMPLVPLTLMLLVGYVPFLQKFPVTIAQAMLFCGIGATIVLRVDPKKAIVAYCEGAGFGVTGVLSIIAAAGAFVAGMNAVGIISTLVELMKSSTSLATIAASIIPFMIAFLSGSGDATMAAFNEAITPYAYDMGLHPVFLSALAYFTASMGRAFSPVGSMTVLTVSNVGVSTTEVFKKGAIPCIAATIIGAIFWIVMWRGGAA